MKSAETALVSVVIVHYNGAALLEACLASIQRQEDRPLEVIVVDNGSTDDSLPLVRSRYPDVRVLEQRRNLGFAEGNNAGVKAARGKYVVLLNNDTEVTPGWIGGLIGQLADPNVAVVTSRVVTDGVPEKFYAMNGSLNPLGYNMMRVFTDLSQVFFAGGASLMFRREEIPQPFLPEYFLYHEDVYLSWRMRLMGRSVRMAQSSVVYHRGSQTTRKHASGIVTFYQERNKLLNALLFYQTSTLVRLLPLFCADAAAKLAASLIVRRKSFRGIMKAYGWCLTHLSWITTQRREHQKGRAVPDTSILASMSSRLLEGDGVAARLINASARGFLRMVGLRCYD